MHEGQQRLRLLGLPVFYTIEDLAAILHIDSVRLGILAKSAERFYCTYRIPKRPSGSRRISQPSREIKGIQAWILRNILDKLSPSPHATAYLPRKRLSDNVSPHSGNRYFLSMKNPFFPLRFAALGIRLMLKRKTPLEMPRVLGDGRFDRLFRKVQDLEEAEL